MLNNCNTIAGTLHNLAVGDPVTQEQIVACDAVPVVLAMTAGCGCSDDDDNDDDDVTVDAFDVAARL